MWIFPVIFPYVVVIANRLLPFAALGFATSKRFLHRAAGHAFSVRPCVCRRWGRTQTKHPCPEPVSSVGGVGSSGRCSDNRGGQTRRSGRSVRATTGGQGRFRSRGDPAGCSGLIMRILITIEWLQHSNEIVHVYSVWILIVFDKVQNAFERYSGLWTIQYHVGYDILVAFLAYHLDAIFF